MSGYIGTQPVPQATQTRDSFTATASQTSFATGGYTPNFLDVYLNGLKLNSSQFTATNGTDVVLTSAASSGDIVEVIAYTTFEVADASFDDLALGGDLTVGGLVASMMIVWRTISPLQTLCTLTGTVSSIHNTINQLHHFFKIDSEEQEEHDQVMRTFSDFNVSFENIGIKFERESSAIINGFS